MKYLLYTEKTLVDVKDFMTIRIAFPFTADLKEKGMIEMKRCYV
jgi:hypothetical protein